MVASMEWKENWAKLGQNAKPPPPPPPRLSSKSRPRSMSSEFQYPERPERSISKCSARSDLSIRSTSSVKADLITRHHSSDFVEQHYDTVQKLGTGTFGRVELVRERSSGRLRVCKKVNTQGMHENLLEMMRKEVRLLTELDHPHIVKMYEFAEDFFQNQLTLILEYIPGGDCMDLLMRMYGQRIGEGLVGRLVHQLLLALSYCHARGVVHRDIKPENVMLTSQQLSGQPLGPKGIEALDRLSLASTGAVDCKLIDFGLATQHTPEGLEMAGTPPYMAPEVAGKRAVYTDKADVWSVGVITFELLTGFAPFGKPSDHKGDMRPVIENVRKYTGFSDLWKLVEKTGCWSKRSLEAADFLKYILCVDPADRPTAARASEHPWLAEHRATPIGLTREMVRSMSNFAVAPQLERCCALVIASKMEAYEQEEFGAVFLNLDADRDGKVTKQDLAKAIAQHESWLCSSLNLDVFLQAANLGGSGDLGLLEFVAACLHGRLQCLGSDELLERAFDALDCDRDGLLHMRDIPWFFGDLPDSLPVEQPFGLWEWRESLVGSVFAPKQPLECDQKCANAMFPTLLTSHEVPKKDPSRSENPVGAFITMFLGKLCSGGTEGAVVLQEDVIVESLPVQVGDKKVPFGKGIDITSHQQQQQRQRPALPTPRSSPAYFSRLPGA